jgi:hypothetical protein
MRSTAQQPIGCGQLPNSWGMKMSDKPTTIVLTIWDLIALFPRIPNIGRDYTIYYPKGWPMLR